MRANLEGHPSEKGHRTSLSRALAEAGTSSALTFAGMAVAGAVSPLIIGKLLDASGGDWSSAFLASIAVMILGPIASLFIRLDPSLGRTQVPQPMRPGQTFDRTMV
jgi:MFS family permease